MLHHLKVAETLTPAASMMTILNQPIPSISKNASASPNQDWSDRVPLGTGACLVTRYY